MNTIFIFRGSPASGKGTITERFVKKIPSKIAFLELDTFRWGFHLTNRKIHEVTAEEHALAYKNYLCVLANYLKNGTYTIVTEGLFSWKIHGPHGCMEDILHLAQESHFRPVPILLYADYDVLFKRNQQRDYSVPEDEFRMLYEYVMNEQSEDEVKINVGKMSVDEIITELCGYIK